MSKSVLTKLEIASTEKRENIEKQFIVSSRDVR